MRHLLKHAVGVSCLILVSVVVSVSAVTSVFTSVFISVLTFAFISSPALANDDPPLEREVLYSEEVIILGSRVKERQITGAAQYIDTATLEKFFYADIQRLLRQAPGVSIQVEDGYGLRPNISIRGVATERSGRITLLEDNVLIAPAPYAAPSAYYFPTTGRISAIEILKGPSAITQGPYTIGGAINMLSTPIPTPYQGSLLIETDADHSYRAHLAYGGTHATGLGFLLETHQWQSDGFQDIDRSNNNTGLNVADYTIKLVRTSADARHSIQLKLQQAEQESNQTYLGLTDADFKDDAFRRYGVSALDKINTKHTQQMLSYQFHLSDTLSFFTTLYNNEHRRDWFKTEGIDLDGSHMAAEQVPIGWLKIVQSINTNTSLGAFMPAQLQAILDGEADTPPGSIQLRSNYREYFSRGIQLKLTWDTSLGASQHAIEAGLRSHQDEEDRLQRDSSYHQQAGQLMRDDVGIWGNAGNRIQAAEAWSFYIYDRIAWGDWVFSPGIRHENIHQKRTTWATQTADLTTATPVSSARTTVDARATVGARASAPSQRRNTTEVWLPGLGLLYSINEQLVLLAGIHQGFTAPSNSPGVKEESAINYELGFRYTRGDLALDTLYFHSDYDNLLGECTASSGSECTPGDAFNGDAATVRGVEIMLTTSFTASEGYRIPLSFNYTYTDSRFDSDVAATDFFGDVRRGDPIPYIPEQQYNLSLGIEANRWTTYLNLGYVSAVCVRASCGEFEKTEATVTLDLSVHFALSEHLSLFGKVENLTDTQHLLGRHPYGARPNKDQTTTLGLKLDF